MILMVNEIFYSLQGESSYMGQPCVFVRLTYCNLRCKWCDTEYAFYEGTHMSVPDILEKVKTFNCNLVEVTGGEPLFQPEVIQLLKSLVDAGFTVLLETGGSLSVADVPREVVKIVDFKCPSSEMEHKNLWTLLNELGPRDEIKFVIADRADYDWAVAKIQDLTLADNWVVHLSPVFGILDYHTLAEWILADRLKVRFQIQLHKHIWDPATRGV
ncbi:MAG: radical SAM protein [FCB group bacterium]|nr:radical SAM protein [FCB group bacterium]